MFAGVKSIASDASGSGNWTLTGYSAELIDGGRTYVIDYFNLLLNQKFDCDHQPTIRAVESRVWRSNLDRSCYRSVNPPFTFIVL